MQHHVHTWAIVQPSVTLSIPRSTPTPELFQRKMCLVRVPVSHVSATGPYLFGRCLNLNADPVSSNTSEMLSCCLLPSIVACWMGLNLDADICHVAFPLSLVTSVMSKPVSQSNLHPRACCHVYCSQEGTAAHAHTLLSCEVR